MKNKKILIAITYAFILAMPAITTTAIKNHQPYYKREIQQKFKDERKNKLNYEETKKLVFKYNLMDKIRKMKNIENDVEYPIEFCEKNIYIQDININDYINNYKYKNYPKISKQTKSSNLTSDIEFLLHDKDFLKVLSHIKKRKIDNEPLTFKYTKKRTEYLNGSYIKRIIDEFEINKIYHQLLHNRNLPNLSERVKKSLRIFKKIDNKKDNGEYKINKKQLSIPQSSITYKSPKLAIKFENNKICHQFLHDWNLSDLSERVKKSLRILKKIDNKKDNDEYTINKKQLSNPQSGITYKSPKLANEFEKYKICHQLPHSCNLSKRVKKVMENDNFLEKIDNIKDNGEYKINKKQLSNPQSGITYKNPKLTNEFEKYKICHQFPHDWNLFGRVKKLMKNDDFLKKIHNKKDNGEYKIKYYKKNLNINNDTLKEIIKKLQPSQNTINKKQLSNPQSGIIYKKPKLTIDKISTKKLKNFNSY